MTLVPMNSCMARPAQRLEIFQRIVSLFARCGDAKPVNVMNVQVIFAAAALAGVVVALQRLDAIPVKAVVVFGLLAILLNLIGVIGRPLSNSSNVSVVLASLALALRPRNIFKWGAAILTRKHVSFTWCANSVTFISAILSLLNAAIFFLTSIASLLYTTFRFVVISAYHARTFCKAALSLAVGCQGTRLAPFGVRRRSCYSLPAIWAVNLTVGFHMAFSKMIPNIYSWGVV